MKNPKGIILALTVAFMVIFTLLGFAAMYLAGLQGQGIEIKTASTKAFWLAEAGVQRAVSQLPGTLFNPADFITLGEGKYKVSTALKPGYHHRWIIDATGRIELYRPIQSRIVAEVGPTDMNAFQTTGTLKPNSENQILPQGNYSEGRENFDWTFDGLFGTEDPSTLPEVQIVTTRPGRTNNPVLADNGTALAEEGIIWVIGDLKITNNAWQYQGILIVDGAFEMTGGAFTGIVWVNGTAKMIEGNPGVIGAVFVNDPTHAPGDGGETKIDSSSAWISYNAGAIDAAYDNLDPKTTSPATFRHIVRWEEKS